MSQVSSIEDSSDLDARSLFERTVSKLSPHAARPLFDRFYEYECLYGDTAAIRKLTKRISDLYPEESTLTRFMKRHTQFDVNPIALHDLPPPLPLQVIPPVSTEDDVSETSSRAGSVQPADLEERRSKLDRFGRRERTNSPNPQIVKKKGNKKELPAVVVEFLAALPPASMFDGATFHIDELVRLLRNTNIPYPAGFVVDAKRARGEEDDGPIGIAKKR